MQPAPERLRRRHPTSPAAARRSAGRASQRVRGTDAARRWARDARVAMACGLALLAGCVAAAPRTPLVRHWGEMRAVLREGRTQGRVALADVLGPNSVAVGALEGLAAEVTVVDGVAHLAEVVDATSPEGLRTRRAAPGDRATLLVAAEVDAWEEHALDDVPDLDALERRIAELAAPTGPLPFRVEGVARRVELHVLDHSCPIAHPDGPAPWRYTGRDEPVTLVGFFAEGAGGVLTHHGRSTHTHALVPRANVSGHLDEVAFAAGARLYLPRR